MRLNVDYSRLQEIRLRSGRPFMVKISDKDYFVEENGRLSESPVSSLIINEGMLKETLEYMLRYSRYAFDEEIRQGYITLSGGHRAGICGRVVAEKGVVKSIKNISSINIRIAHEVKGCADKVMPYVYDNERVRSVLLIAPPCCGKTTLLRDMIRQVSDGNAYCHGMNAAVIDERSELAACYQGVWQNDVGVRTDVLDACPKSVGMMMAVRALSPAVIAVDEIGGAGDAEALRYVINCGCSVFATAHGYSLEDIKSKPVLSELVADGSFERFVILKKGREHGEISLISDRSGTNHLYTAGQRGEISDRSSTNHLHTAGQRSEISDRSGTNHLLQPHRRKIGALIWLK